MTERVSTKVKKRAFLEALQQSMGIITPAMEVAGISSRSTITQWRQNDRSFAKAMEDISERACDFVESKLLGKIDEGDTTSLIFYLKTKGKDRGYSERTEITGRNGEAIEMNTRLSANELKELYRELENE